MFRKFTTLLRGLIYETTQESIDQNAMALLRQQIRDAAKEVHQAKISVSIVIAEHKLEIKNHTKLTNQIQELEERALVALHQDKEELAKEAAKAIATLENDRSVSLDIQQKSAKNLEFLKSRVQEAEHKLHHLQNEQKLVRAKEKTQKLNTQSGPYRPSSLHEAQETLDIIKTKQEELSLTQQAFEDLNSNNDPERLNAKLAEAGCGEKQHISADDVLERLRKKARVDSVPA